MEAKRQQRAMDASNIYKRQGGDGISPTFETPMGARNDIGGEMPSPGNAPHNLATRPRPMGAPSNPKAMTNGTRSRSCEVMDAISLFGSPGNVTFAEDPSLSLL